MANGEPKQVIIVRKDLNMRKGKMVAQGSHASLKTLLDVGSIDRTTTREGGMDKIQVRRTTLSIPLSEEWDVQMYNTEQINRQAAIEWLEGRFTKVCVSVDSEQELLDIYEKAQQAGLLCSLIKDSGLTEFNGVPTLTCAAIGPAYPSEVDPITGHLKLL